MLNINKLFPTLLIILLSNLPVWAIVENEIPLDEITVDKDNVERELSPENKTNNKFKLKTAKFFENRKKINFENSFFNELSGEIRYQGIYSFEKDDNNLTGKYPFSINSVIETKFDKEKYRFLAEYAFTRNVKGYDSEFFAKFANLYLEGKINDKNKFKIGTYTAPIGVEGPLSMFYLPLHHRGQISRNLTSSLATGLSFFGENEVFDYNIGTFTTTRYSQGFKDGMELAGRLGVKPFGKTDIEALKNLKLYGGADIGHRSKDYEVYTSAIYYDYKNFSANIEYAYANGSNTSKYNDKKRQGFFTTVTYKATPKLHLIARYDFFNQNCKEKNNINQEYTIGINYYIFKERLMVGLNYLFAHNNKTHKNKNGAYFMTQFFI